MIYPSIVDCLKSLEYTLDSKIKPALSGTSEQSAAATMGHILRFIARRVEREGQVLSDDIRTLRTLLPELAEHLASRDAAVSRTIAEALERQYRPDGAYCDLASLAEEAGALREALEQAHRWILSDDRAKAGQAGHEAIRGKIRAYVAAQLAGEASLIEPAFVGHGPRR